MGPMAGPDGVENLAPTGIRSPDRVACSESLYRLSSPGPQPCLIAVLIDVANSLAAMRMST